MSTEKLQHQLFKAAQKAPLKDCVPLGFEKRVMARLQNEYRAVRPLAVLAKGLWAACAPAVAMAVIAFILSSQQQIVQDVPADLALENAVMSPLMAESEIW